MRSLFFCDYVVFDEKQNCYSLLNLAVFKKNKDFINHYLSFFVKLNHIIYQVFLAHLNVFGINLP
ncbi:hypothetical protein C1H71_10065 [Iodobacter fluviatilis]|uniref:Uncharacterized protein n=1 Tax=Iodobacter fluviatilis TaxID=537 RepID=A0A7G3G9J3_9NEIS|nr:hypothetical protein C1H71_10065 [Iodobacter fluviatilis]